MEAETRKKIRSRANRIAGQIGGVQKMIEEDRYCLDILNQISAVRSALDALGLELLTQHLERCVLGHGTDTQHPDAAAHSPEELVAEVHKALERFLR